ncbi:MAG: ABC transporter ATP-binding protein [Leucobacter sp.]
MLREANVAVSVEQVTKKFGDFTAVENLNLEIHEGEFFSMLGPSGSGKTTVLRMIAGFENVTSGKILLHGQDVTAAAPFDREVNTVFQDYALFPHLTIAENVAYGLRVRGVSKSERTKLVGEALEQVQLSAVAGRLPSQLSGGQRQRIALARALILRPKVLLLDEPLGALDKQLREQMQIELKQIQREVGITFVFVTHDQEEALTLSDRVAVFSNGKVEQIGSPREVYEYPGSEFVARFLGITNIIPAEVSHRFFGSSELHSLRPERVELLDPTAPLSAGSIAQGGTIAEIVYAGAHTRYLVDTEDGTRYIAETQNRHTPRTDAGLHRGDTVSLRFEQSHATPIPGTQTAAAAA